MPIAGLTNPAKSFLKIGQIRKGEMREFKRRDGSTYTAPVDLDYFRVTFRPDENECATEFQRIYGDMPRRINIRFPFKTIEENYDANYEAYSKGGLIAKAASNAAGPYWVFYRDHETGEVLVRNGSPVGENGYSFFKKPIDLTQPVYTYRDSKGNTIPVLLEPVGRLQVVIPEISHLRVGYLEFRPTSPKDIAALARELAAIEMLAQQAHRDLSGIPMVLTRREETITKNIDGKLSQGQSWLVHIEVMGAWGQKALEVLERQSLPEIVDGVIKELPMDEEWDGEPEHVTGIPEPEPEMEPAKPAPKANQSTTPQTEKPPKPPETNPQEKVNAARPYAPDVFKSKFLDACVAIEKNYAESGKTCEVSDHNRKVLAAVLGKHCFKGNQLFRHEFLDWLCDDPSTATISCIQVRVLLKIMNISGNDFDEKPDEVAVKEIIQAHEYSVQQIQK